MTDLTPKGEPAAHQRLEEAREVYSAIFRALQASVGQLEAGKDTASDARHRQDLYRAHI